MKFIPNFLLRDLIGWILAIGVLAALAALFPWELGEKADAFAPAPAGIKPSGISSSCFRPEVSSGEDLGIDGEVLGIMAFNLSRCSCLSCLSWTAGRESRTQIDLQYHWRGRASLHRCDDNRRIRDVNLDNHGYSSKIGT